MKKVIFYTLVLGAAASLLHFAYDWANHSIFVGLFTPINESIWEHLKLLYFPILVFSVISAIKKKSPQALLAGAVATLVSPLIVIYFYYGYTGAFGVRLMFLDIFSVFFAQFISLLLYSRLLRVKNPNRCLVLVLCILAVIPAFFFIIFTLSPPELPIFIPPPITK